MINREQLTKSLLANLENAPKQFGKPVTYEDSMKKYNCIRNCDPVGVQATYEEFTECCMQAWTGRLSSDNLQNGKYLFCMWGTLASRVAVESGLDMDVSMSVLQCFTKLMDRCQTIDNVCELFRALFLEYIDLIRQKPNVSMSKKLARAMQYINHNIFESLSVSAVAAYCGCSVRQITRLFLDELQTTVSQYITKQKLMRAQQYLRYSDQSIAEISAMLGFSSQSYFTKLFRDAFAQTPRKFRENNKKLLPTVDS